MASGLIIADLYADNNIPTGTNDVIPDTFNAHNYSKFTSGQSLEKYMAEFTLPSQYSNGGFTVNVWAGMESAISGNVNIDISFERNNEGFSVTSDSFAAAKSVDGTVVPATIKTLFKVAFTFLNSEIDGLAAGELGRIKVIRDGVNDTASGYLAVGRIIISET